MSSHAPSLSLADALTAVFIARLQEESEVRGRGNQGTFAEEAGLNPDHLRKILSTERIGPNKMFSVLRNLGWTIEHDGFVVGPVVESATQP